VAPAKSWFEWLWSEERRQRKRQTSLPLAAYYWDGASPQPRQVRDISPDGMYLLTEQRWYPNTLITMTLSRSDRTNGDPGRSIVLVARVIRSGTDGVGFAFVQPRANRFRSVESSFSEGADRKTLIEFLANIRADIRRNICRVYFTGFLAFLRSIVRRPQFMRRGV
jgi:hypothetical protein